MQSLNFGFLLHHLVSNFVCKNHFENLLKYNFLDPFCTDLIQYTGPSICISNKLSGNAAAAGALATYRAAKAYIKANGLSHLVKASLPTLGVAV